MVARRWITITLAVKVTLALLALTIAGLLAGSSEGWTHRSTGCNHVPIVYGQAAYHCALQP